MNDGLLHRNTGPAYCVKSQLKMACCRRLALGKRIAFFPFFFLPQREREDEVAGDLQLRHFQSMVLLLLLFPSFSLSLFLHMFL